MIQAITILWLASILDYLLGDPWGWLHPVQVMGWFIRSYTNLVINHFSNRLIRKIVGILLGLGLILGSGFLSWLLINVATQINPYFASGLQIVLLASCFAGRSLRQAAEDVLQYLRVGDIKQARYRLSFYVGRDTEQLTSAEIYRALLETVAENTTDGVTAPLFYALCGLFIPVVGCVPLTIAYKASSTLDSMIGYRQEPYLDLGWFSAKVEDCLTWLPCRLTVLTLALISGDVWHKISLCREYASKDPSPNSGWSESIYAIILGVQLGGVNTYQGKKKLKPLLGKPLHPIKETTIAQALALTRTCILLWLSLSSVIIVFLHIL